MSQNLQMRVSVKDKSSVATDVHVIFALIQRWKTFKRSNPTSTYYIIFLINPTYAYNITFFINVRVVYGQVRR